MSRAIVACLHFVLIVTLRANAADLGVAWNGASAASRPFDTSPPFAPTAPALAGGAEATLRFFAGKAWAVSQSGGTVTAIEPSSWTAIRTYSVGSEPLDVAVVSAQRAYVTRANATSLVRLDLVSGVTQNVVPLGSLADPDGIPDLGTMTAYGGRLFVQIRRWNENEPFRQASPAYLAVVDLASESLIRAIALQGMAPKGKMQVVGATRRLFVNAAGGDFDAGGIEMIDLDSLQSLGLVIEEADGKTGSDLHAFVLTSPTRGFLAYTTDLTLSSHLTTFTVGGEADPGELIAVVGYAVPALAHDLQTNAVFMPVSDGPVSGFRAFHALTGAQLTPAPAPTAGPPTDVQLLCDCASEGCSLESRCAAGSAFPYQMEDDE